MIIKTTLKSFYNSDWIHRLAMFILFTLIGLILLVFYWLFYPYKIVEFKSPSTVIESRIKSGNNLRYTVDACKYLKKEAIVKRYLVNRILFQFSPETSDAPLGCRKTTLKIKIPKHTFPSKYTLLVEMNYKVNPLRSISYSFETEEFEVFE